MNYLGILRKNGQSYSSARFYKAAKRVWKSKSPDKWAFFLLQFIRSFGFLIIWYDSNVSCSTKEQKNLLHFLNVKERDYV